ncbi:MAG: glycosyltransferase family 2 protein [Flavobacteriaceae bacterium]|jgi:GT2 family glycosyltransferase|nr:glycosyltransferase family 2 protein [Flavobacteriaceae bacterium]
MTKVASIIVAYNGEKWIRHCLDSLLQSSFQTDIFVIDNASADLTTNIIKDEYLDVTLFKSEENFGFGKANNLMFERLYKVNYDYFFLLNQDAWVEKNCIYQLVDFMEKYPEYGILSPLHYNKNFSEIDFNFKEYLSKGKKINEIENVPFVNAAAWLLSKSCLEKVGLFNPYFRHYGEDRNYCNRVEYKGFKIGILSKAKANHDRNRVTDLNKIIKLAEIKLNCILLNPGNNFITACLNALKNVFGIPKYFHKTLPFSQVVEIFLRLSKHYAELFFSSEIRKNRKAQKEDAFLIKE